MTGLYQRVRESETVLLVELGCLQVGACEGIINIGRGEERRGELGLEG